MSSVPTVLSRLKTPLPNDRFAFTDKQGQLTKQAQNFFQAQQNAQSITIPVQLAASHAARVQSFPATGYPSGSTFYEQDRGVEYTAIGGIWVWTGGIMQVTQSNLPTDLNNGGDINFLVNVTDYNHLLQWNGNTWQWGPGDPGSGFIAQFIQPQAGSPLAAPYPGTGWQVCDGSVNVLTLQADGTLQFTTVPNSAGFFFRT